MQKNTNNLSGNSKITIWWSVNEIWICSSTFSKGSFKDENLFKVNLLGIR